MATPPDFTSGAVLTAAQMDQIGLWKITNGTFTAASTRVALPTGTFTTAFASYRVFFRVTAQSSGGGVNYSLVFRSAGTDSTVGMWNTYSSGIDRNGTAVTKTSTDTVTSPLLDSYSSAYPNMNFTLDVHAPMLGVAKYVTGHASQILKGTSVNSVATTTLTFDSMSFLIDSGTITGSYSVYGYNPL